MADDEKFDGSDDASQERPEDGANENESDFSTDDSGEIGANNRVSEHLKPHYNKDGQLILPDGTNLIQTSIQDELEASYLTYSMSVIVSRAIPDVRDGLKPSQRRILVAMNDLNLGPHSQRVKCAKISGDASGNYHPHGEAIIYPTLVRMAQDWNMRHVLVDKQGNFGSSAGLPPAAMRYTEARLSGFAVAMLEDLNLDTVDFMPTYDETRMEPVVLPSKAPNLLVNGANGIAVGMATSIPPHNLGEICDAAVAVIDNPSFAPERASNTIKRANARELSFRKFLICRRATASKKKSRRRFPRDASAAFRRFGTSLTLRSRCASSWNSRRTRIRTSF